MSEQPIELAPSAAEAAERKKRKKKDERNRGIETMFRVTYKNHIALSQLADNKANMLISINGLIISVMIALLTPRFDSLSLSMAPVLLLIAGCMVSLTFAVIGARPRLSRQEVTPEDVRGNTGNVLFFGQFTSMTLPEFQESLHILRKDRKLLYDNLSRQLYLMGQSLNRKYHYLQVAYVAFLAGTGLATVAFLLVYATVGFGT